MSHEMSYQKRLGIRIAVARCEKNYSQRFFALMIELNRNTLSAIENGGGNPTLGTLERIAVGLEIGLDELLDCQNGLHERE